MKLEGQAALVTGGGSGLGAATARELARQGAKVAVLDINAEGAAQVAQEIGGLGLRCDITSTESVQQALAAAREAHGPARILMNVAGIGGAKRIVGKDGSPMPIEDFKRVVDVNLVGTFNVIRLAAAEMAKLEALEDGARGVIVNTASVAAYDGQIGQEAYAASKGGLVSLTLPLSMFTNLILLPAILLSIHRRSIRQELIEEPLIDIEDAEPPVPQPEKT